jgi:DNA mismatch repair ATPase MutS
MPANGFQTWKALSASAQEIKNLKVGYNKVFGYYIEITNMLQRTCSI